MFEVGDSESYPRLVADKDLWLTGGAPVVNVVVLIKWTRVAGNCVKGFIEVWRRGAPNPQRIVSINRFRSSFFLCLLRNIITDFNYRIYFQRLLLAPQRERSRSTGTTSTAGVGYLQEGI